VTFLPVKPLDPQAPQRRIAYDPAKPHQAYPEAMYKAMIAAPDDVILKTTKFDPPVKVPV
jgi:hypothetical protein